MSELINLKYIIAALFFSIMGIIVLGVSFWIFDKISPGNLAKEIIEEHNTALAIVVGAFILAISQIIASAIHG